jgi:transposase-like protein
MPQGRRRHKKESDGFKPWQTVDRCPNCEQPMAGDECLNCKAFLEGDSCTVPRATRTVRRPKQEPSKNTKKAPKYTDALVGVLHDHKYDRPRRHNAAFPTRVRGLRPNTRIQRSSPSPDSQRWKYDERERVREWRLEQVSYRNWLHAEDEEQEAEFCPCCAEPIEFVVSPLGRVLPQCRVCGQKIADGPERLTRAPFGRGGPLVQRRRFFGSNHKRPPGQLHGKPGVPVVNVPRDFGADALAGALMLRLRVQPVPDSELACVDLIEEVRWGGAVTCPCCDASGAYQMTAADRVTRNSRFLWRCRTCKKQFTAKIGTFMEGAKVTHHQWLIALRLLDERKDRIGAPALGRAIGVHEKTAHWVLRKVRRGFGLERVA